MIINVTQNFENQLPHDDLSHFGRILMYSMRRSGEQVSKKNQRKNNSITKTNFVIVRFNTNNNSSNKLFFVVVLSLMVSCFYLSCYCCFSMHITIPSAIAWKQLYSETHLSLSVFDILWSVQVSYYLLMLAFEQNILPQFRCESFLSSIV